MTENQWQAARKIAHRASHVAVATVGPDGQPHVTPIGSLLLHPREFRGYWLEKYPTALPRNLDHDPRIQILAVNSGMWFWFRSLWAGGFTSPPAVRLVAVAGPVRPATNVERDRFLKRVAFARRLKGHNLLWSGMTNARDITVEAIEPVRLGPMWPGTVGP